MKKRALLLLLVLLAFGVAMIGCQPSAPAAEEEAAPEATPAAEETPATEETPAEEETPPAEVEPTVLESLRVPEIASTESEIIYTQDQRANLGGRDMIFWPDGNIGFIPMDGQYRFFAANGAVIGRTVGTFDDPGATVEDNRQLIQGLGTDFDYAAGGPVYRDPDTGMLLMFYHAEDHFGGSGMPFHAFIGLAASQDDGETFQDLGLILTTNAEPDVNAVCCADMGGATFTIRDGTFYLYFRDRMQIGYDVQLAVATAPVDEVVEAALSGTTSEWVKYFLDGTEPGLGGRSSPLEVGNPQTSWFSVSYNTAMDRFIMAIARHGLLTDPAELVLIASEDGFNWSPRVVLRDCDCELTYPTIISPDGNPLETGETFYIYYVTTDPTAQYRWHASPLNRMTVTLTGEMVELPHEWEFETDAGGWVPLNQIPSMEISDGALVIEPTGNDPYMQSPSLGLSTEAYTTIEVRMRSEANGNGQFFFTSTDSPDIWETSSVRFPVRTGGWNTYTVEMAGAPGWSGHLGILRFDPIDQAARVEIDYIRLLP
jgi:hypothetical protein